MVHLLALSGDFYFISWSSLQYKGFFLNSWHPVLDKTFIHDFYVICTDTKLLEAVNPRQMTWQINQTSKVMVIYFLIMD